MMEAWKCCCGHLNEGEHEDGAVCGGCMFEVRSELVEARYVLVEQAS